MPKIILHIGKIKILRILTFLRKLSTSDKVTLFRARITAIQEGTFDLEICAAQISALIRLYIQIETPEQSHLIYGTELIIDPYIVKSFLTILF